MQILNKITIKGVCGKLENYPNMEEGVDLIQVIGNVRDKEEIKTQYGESWKLKGEFKAINLTTKEDFFSAACFLPSLAEQLIVNQLELVEGGAVQFAFVIGIRSAKNAVGYEYTVKPLIAPAENNALTLIEKQIKQLT